MIEGLTFDDVQIIPKNSDIESREDCDTTTELVKGIELKIPVVSSPMDTVTEWQMMKELNRIGAIGVLHRFMTIEKMEQQLNECNFEPIVIAVGSKLDDIKERLFWADEYEVKAVLIDIAHGHSVHTERAIKYIKDKWNLKVIAGNIATAKGAEDLTKWGADSLRVGIGGGSLCETRIRTGVGVPMITSIQEVAGVSDLPIIADGGIRTPADVAKAIVAGADSVMIGSLLAGTKESPGKLIREGLFPDEQLFKMYRGSASQSAKIDRGENDEHIEGNSKKIPYKGKAERIIEAIEDGLRSSMSYVGARTLKEFRNKAEFIKITLAGQIEAQPHLLIK